MSMPRVGSKQSIVWTPSVTQRAIVTFCWLPPDSRRTSAPARASIWSISTARLTFPRSRPRSIGPHRRSVATPGSEMFSRPVRCDVHDAGTDGICGMAEGCGRTVDEDFATTRADRPGEDVEQLVLALAFQRDDAENLARVDLERDVLEGGPRREALAGEARGRALAPGDGLPGRLGPLGQLADLAEHQFHDPFLGARRHIDDAHGRAFAQDRRTIADRGDLDHPMRDEDHRARAAPLAADHVEHVLGEIGRERRGHL